MDGSYSRRKHEKKHIYKEERDDLLRYLRDSLKYQEWIFYCLLLILGLATIVFIRYLFT